MIRSFILAFVAVAISHSSFATLVQWSVADGGNGHWYDVVLFGEPPTLGSWTTAFTAARSRGGYLATITTEAENAFVVDLIDDSKYWNYMVNGLPGLNFWEGPWIGGYQPVSGSATDKGWVWVSGEPMGYTNWFPGLPDDLRLYGWFTPQDHMHYWAEGTHAFGEFVPMWDDTNNIASAVISYVVEYNAPVPESTTMSLLGIAGGFLLTIFWRRHGAGKTRFPSHSGN